MRKIVRNVTLALVAVALLGLGTDHLYAQEGSQAKGSISGTILGKEGKPMVGLQVRLERMDPVKMDPGGGRRGRSSGFDSGAHHLQKGGEGGMKIIGKATTDAAGKFTISNLEPGSATLVAGGQKIGWIYTEINVEPGKNTDVGELKLQEI